VLWVGVVIGFLALAVAGPVAMIRESRPAQRAAAASGPAAAAAPVPAGGPAPVPAGGFGISAFVRGRPRHG
jgi:uncharacterized membrane protein